jgi:hypothetical protein
MMNRHAREKKRRSEIIRELCKLSKNGWADARASDYEPLEKELRELELVIEKTE